MTEEEKKLRNQEELTAEINALKETNKELIQTIKDDKATREAEKVRSIEVAGIVTICNGFKDSEEYSLDMLKGIKIVLDNKDSFFPPEAVKNGQIAGSGAPNGGIELTYSTMSGPKTAAQLAEMGIPVPVTNGKKKKDGVSEEGNL